MKKTPVILTLIFLFVLAARLYYSFSTPYLSSDESYFNLRQIEHISETGSPLFNDDLSYSGRAFAFNPGFHYLLAVVGYAMPLGIAAKVFPNIFASLVVIFAFLLAKKLTQKDGASLFTAFISGFIPVFFNETFNNLSVYSLFAPLLFLLIYLFLNIKKRLYLYLYLALLVMLSLMHPAISVFMIALIIYMILIRLERIEQDRAEIELIIFSLFFVIWIESLFLKDLLIFHGPAVIWQNIPKELLSNYFSRITLLQGIYSIGILPFFYGIYTIYDNLFRKKDKQIYLLISFAMAVGLLLWLRLIELNFGLILLGIALTILFSQFYSYYTKYITTTRASRFLNGFIFLLLLAFVLTSIIPSLALARNTAEHSVPKAKMLALEWLSSHTHEDSVILAGIDEGNLVTAVAGRRNVFDNNFLLIKDADETFNDVRRIFTTQYSTEAVELLNKYSIDYILLSQDAKEYYNIRALPYLSNECFELVYENNEAEIYRPLCRLEEISD